MTSRSMVRTGLALLCAGVVAGCQPATGTLTETAASTRAAPLPPGALAASNKGRTGVAAPQSSGRAMSLLNAQRAAQGGSRLRNDARLQRAAQGHANWMAQNGVMSHRGAGGSKMTARIARAGYSACFAAENVAMGQDTDRQVMAAWMGSSGHRRNMMHVHARAAGVAKATDANGQTYWAMVLAAPC